MIFDKSLRDKIRGVFTESGKVKVDAEVTVPDVSVSFPTGANALATEATLEEVKEAIESGGGSGNVIITDPETGDPIPVIQSPSDTHVFHDDAESADDGSALIVGAYKRLLVEITGSSTDKIVAFKGTMESGVYTTIQGIRKSDYTLGTNTTGGTDITPEIWAFDIELFNSVIMDLTSIDNGNVTVKGRASL